MLHGHVAIARREQRELFDLSTNAAGDRATTASSNAEIACGSMDNPSFSRRSLDPLGGVGRGAKASAVDGDRVLAHELDQSPVLFERGGDEDDGRQRLGRFEVLLELLARGRGTLPFLPTVGRCWRLIASSSFPLRGESRRSAWCTISTRRGAIIGSVRAAARRPVIS